MPIFEYVCRGCSEEFETLVLGSRQPSCPNCDGCELEKQMSAFDFDPRYRNHYYQRLKYGLMHCFARQYLQIEDLSTL